MRTFSILDALDISEYFDIDAKSWIEDKRNILLIDDRGNMTAFEYSKAGVYRGHYFFKDRGKEALKAASSFLEEFFQQPEEPSVLIGVTPLTYLGARWLNRKIGLESNGVIETPTGPSEMFMMTRKQWQAKKEIK